MLSTWIIIMARLPRLNMAHISQHVVQRGNNKHACFFAEKDYIVYLDKLKIYSKKYQVEVHAFVLMTNHVHLLMTPQTKTGVSQLMQALGRYYVRYINQTYQRTGTLWEGRFKSALVDSENYFLIVSKYIELNPVRAGMVSHPARYPWSSFRGNATDMKIELLTPHLCYQQLGNNDLSRQASYSALFEGEIPENSLTEIRSAINKAWVLGDEKFKAQIEKQLQRRVSPQPRGGDRRSKNYHAQNKKDQ